MTSNCSIACLCSVLQYYCAVLAVTTGMRLYSLAAKISEMNVGMTRVRSVDVGSVFATVDRSEGLKLTGWHTTETRVYDVSACARSTPPHQA